MNIFTLTLTSLRGIGTSSERISVTIGPSLPASTIVSPSLRVPFSKIISIVVPSPGRAFTSRTVAWSSSLYISRFANGPWHASIINANKFPIPSPAKFKKYKLDKNLSSFYLTLKLQVFNFFKTTQIVLIFYILQKKIKKNVRIS